MIVYYGYAKWFLTWTHWVSWVFQLPSPFHTQQSWFLLILSKRFTNLGLALSRLMSLFWEPLNTRGHTQFISWTKDQLCTLASALGMVQAALLWISASGRWALGTKPSTLVKGQRGSLHWESRDFGSLPPVRHFWRVPRDRWGGLIKAVSWKLSAAWAMVTLLVETFSLNFP